jgi:alginate production protein
MTWMAKSGLNFTLAYALGQGDKPNSQKDNSFRQTGLQDNNAKFGGVTSFKYYGELTDPELSNLEIITAGIGFRYEYQISVDLVVHYYEQNQLSQQFVGAEIRKRPNGLDAELGWEADVVFGWRPHISWDLEVIAAYFEPGEAFGAADSAMLGKLQLRYRF